MYIIDLLYSNSGTESKVSLTALSAITSLKKLCNHPDLVWDKITSNADGFEGALKLLPNNYEELQKKYYMKFFMYFIYLQN